MAYVDIIGYAENMKERSGGQGVPLTVTYIRSNDGKRRSRQRCITMTSTLERILTAFFKEYPNEELKDEYGK